MKLYDILVVWFEWNKRGYARRQRWVRGIPASSLTEASNKALSGFANRIHPSVSMGWPRWPDTTRTLPQL